MKRFHVFAAIAIFLFLLAPHASRLTPSAHAQVAVDTTGLQATINTTSPTISNFTSSGSNRAVVVFVTCSSNAPTVTGVNYDGVAMTQAWNVSHGSGFFRHSAWYLTGQTTAANVSIVGTFGSSCNDSYMTAISMTGVDQATPLNTVPTPTSGNGMAMSITATTASGELIVAKLLADGNTVGEMADGADQTTHRSSSANGAGKKLQSQPGASGGAITETLTNSRDWSMGAVSVRAASGGAAPLCNRALLGVGC